MKYQLNWHLFNLSNNYLLQKKLDDCIILYDDKDYINVNLKYYQDILFITNTNTFVNNYLCDIFEKEVESQLADIISYGEYVVVPIYSNITLKNKKQITVVNIGIFILSDFKFKTNTVYMDSTYIFILRIKYGLEATETDVEELKKKCYPELKADVNDILYIKQAGFYFNLFKCFNYTYKHNNNKIQLELPVNSIDDLVLVDIGDIFENAHSYWDKWQIIWRSNKHAITQYLKYKPWNSMSSITDNTTKKYRNIVFNQSLMSENKVINSLSEFNCARFIHNIDNQFKPINNANNTDTNTNTKRKVKGSSKDDDMTAIISKIGDMSLHKGKTRKTYEQRLSNYSRFTGSKHLHYLKREKVKDKSIIEMLRGLNL